MKKFHVYTEEKVTRSYLVPADSEAEARKKFEDGEFDREYPGEAIDCEVIKVVEVNPNE